VSQYTDKPKTQQNESSDSAFVFCVYPPIYDVSLVYKIQISAARWRVRLKWKTNMFLFLADLSQVNLLGHYSQTKQNFGLSDKVLCISRYFTVFHLGAAKPPTGRFPHACGAATAPHRSHLLREKDKDSDEWNTLRNSIFYRYICQKVAQFYFKSLLCLHGQCGRTFLSRRCEIPNIKRCSSIYILSVLHWSCKFNTKTYH
jgi:hypothetical protein